MLAIYMPGKRRSLPEVLDECGAGWFRDPSDSLAFAEVLEGGPDGGGGMLAFDDQCRRPLAAMGPGQKWTPCVEAEGVEAGQYWVGVWEDCRPTPDDLQRADVVESYPVRLADGQEWLVPIAPLLPKRLTLNRATGQQEDVVLSKHRQFAERSNEIFALLIGDEFHDRLRDHLQVVIPGGLRYAADALQKNYRVNLDAVDALELIGHAEAIEIAGIATGLIMVGDFAKKNGPGSLLAATS